MDIQVISATVIENRIHAVVQAVAPPIADIVLSLEFEISGPTDIELAALDEALKYLDPA